MADPKTEQWGTAPEVDADRVLWRIDSKGYQRDSSPTKWVARYVPYLNAATVGALLDEWVGPARWWDNYHVGGLAGQEVLWCSLTIEFPQATVTKVDVGVSPGGDGEMAAKGIVSDAFKRAASLKWGVGRNVYTMPSLWAPCRESNGRFYPTDETKAVLTRQLIDLGFDVRDASLDEEG